MSLKPEYYKEKAFEIINFNTEFFYPDENKQNGLNRLVIFRERTMKHSIPNGSVWYYDKNKDYNPDILGDDIGCGATMSLLKHSTDIQNDDFVRDVMKVVSEMDVHL
ncbi:MAG: hypothetical protein SVK54_08170, partial [candidate division WOR-3 bacterium]|nr:hypothetical protein [candidate division WOR-3 bacterium]